MGESKFFAPGSVLLAALWIVPFSAKAQDNVAAAGALFEQGLAEMQRGQFESGCPKLAESVRLDRRAGALFTTAECYALWGRVATAVDRYKEFLNWYQDMTPAEREKQSERAAVAEQKHTELAPLVPTLTMRLAPGAPQGTVVKLNGKELGEGSLNTPLPLDPGEYSLSTQAPGGAVHEQKIKLKSRELKSIDLEVKAADTSSKVPISGTSGRRSAAYISMGLGAASLITGGILGIVLLGKKGDIDEHCGSAVGQSDPKRCDDIGVAAAQSIDGPMGIVSPVLLGLGAAALGTGLFLYFTEPKTEAPSAATSKWLGVGMLNAGPGTMIVGAQGQF